MDIGLKKSINSIIGISNSLNILTNSINNSEGTQSYTSVELERPILFFIIFSNKKCYR